MRSLLIVASLLLAACATPPVATGPTPDRIIAGGVAEGPVHWGGEIVVVTNLRDRTLVEVLARPLADNGRPLAERNAQGRFLVEQAGFLEPREYAPGRLLEVHGRLEGFANGRVGDAPYRFPIVLAERLNLWARPAGTVSTSPRVNFGVGVSNHGGGVGVGIGF